MNSVFWYSGALIAPRKEGFDVVLSKHIWVHRDSLRKAKWVSTVYKNLVRKTFENELASGDKSDCSGTYIPDTAGSQSVGKQVSQSQVYL